MKVNLKRGKEFIGLSPFKNEKTPSFTVNDDKVYHCFSTGNTEIFLILMKLDNQFGEVVRSLAQELECIIISQKKMKKRKGIAKNQKLFEIFFSINRSSIQYKSSHLKYLIDRGLSKNTIQNFKIGFYEDSKKIQKNSTAIILLQKN